MKTLLPVLSLMALAACSNPEGATKALTAQGYSQIKITGYRWTGCGKDDTYSTGFEARGPSGVQTSGVVCQGVLFKGSTVRTD